MTILSAYISSFSRFQKNRSLPQIKKLVSDVLGSKADIFRMFQRAKVKNAAAAAAKSRQSCPTLYDPIDWTMQPTRLPGPWDSPGKNTGVGCHFLLQGKE